MWRNDYKRDEEGAVTIFIVIMFAFLLGLAGLVFDVGRIYNVHSQAQAYVDEVALAAAAELDGEAGSLQRAIRAAVGDTQRNALLDPGFRLSLSNDNAVNVESLVFLASIANDPPPESRSPVAGDTVLCTLLAGQSPADAGCPADADGRAAFVLINATTETEDFLLFPIARAFVPAVITEASVAPQALAGFTREVCNIPPMAICNPQEASTGGGGFTAIPGQQILLQTQGANSAWAPGDFGFLDLSEMGPNGCSGGGANFLRCVLGALNPNTACVSAEVDMNPGQVTSADVGFNIRFDIFESPFQGEKSNPNFAPDLNVTKGALNNQCRLDKMNADPAASQTVPMPRDPGISVTNRIGSGVALTDLQNYWATNNPTLNGGLLPASVTTRYEAYLYENAYGIPNKSATGGENGNPTCSTVGGIPDRRRMVVAVINCIEHSVKGSASDIPVVEFMEMFLTEPAGDPLDPSNHDIYAEVISVVKPGGQDGVLHEFPVLYR